MTKERRQTEKTTTEQYKCENKNDGDSARKFRVHLEERNVNTQGSLAFGVIVRSEIEIPLSH